MTGMSADIPVRNHPLVIHPDSHPIRLGMMDKDAVHVMRKLNSAGFSSYLVGGGVRDLYLGKQPKDFDISTDARPGQIRKLFPNSSTIGRRFRLVQVFFKSGKVIEVSTLRSLSEHDLDGPEAVLAPNNTYGTLPDDAQRRDLSINSLFYEIENHTIIDYIGGVRDLDNSTIRIIGNPEKRINRDPVRMLRAIRHSARANFAIDSETWAAIRHNRHKLDLCPPSRIRDELFKDLYGGSAEKWFELAVESELFQTIFPFYSSILRKAPKGQPTSQEQLKRIFSLIDIYTSQGGKTNGHRMPKYFTLALLMLPWAEYTFNLSRLQLKGPAAFKLAKKLRREIDTLLGIRLNLRRSFRQEMVTLIANLPQFVRFVHNGSSPKWLKRKSYYTKCNLFYQLHLEVIATQKGDQSSMNLLDELPVHDSPNDQKAQFSRRKIKPAFSPKKKGGVFGFRK